MPETPKDQMMQRFRDMRDERLKFLLEYHRKYAAIIEQVLEERKKEE